MARMLVTEAYDRAVITEKSQHFSSGCSVVGWIKEFFQPKVANDVLNIKPANCKGERLEDVFKDARIRFTHFTKAADDHIIDTHAMFAAFARGMAFTCRNCEGAIDFILPVLLNSAKLSSWVMTAIFFQVKRHKKAGNYHIDAAALKFFHQEPADKLSPDDRPYIAFVLDLGVQPKYSDSAVLAAQDLSEENSLPQTSATFTKTTPQNPSKVKVSVPPTRPDPRLNAPVVHPRYEVHFEGCSNTLYRVIEEADRPAYQELLGIHEFLYEHSRPETIPQVMNLKPMFALGRNSYSWVESEVLNPKVAPPDQLKEGQEHYWLFECEEEKDTELTVSQDAGDDN